MSAKFKSYLKTILKSVIFKNAEGVFLKKLVWTEKKKPRCVGAFSSIYQAFRKSGMALMRISTFRFFNMMMTMLMFMPA